MTELSARGLALLGAVADEDRPLSELGARETVQVVLSDLVRRGYLDVCELAGGRALSRRAAELALEDDRSWDSARLTIRVTRAGLLAWEASRAARARSYAELEREARHLRGF